MRPVGVAKERKGQKLSCVKLAICPDHPRRHRPLKFYFRGRVREVVIYFKFHENRSRGLGAVEGRKSPSPIDLAHGLYSSLYYRTSRDRHFIMTMSEETHRVGELVVTRCRLCQRSPVHWRCPTSSQTRSHPPTRPWTRRFGSAASPYWTGQPGVSGEKTSRFSHTHTRARDLYAAETGNDKKKKDLHVVYDGKLN